jgi:hypothetical protein
MEINVPEVVAEVTAAFDKYEKALNSNDVTVLDQLFWKSPHTLRYGVGEQLYGYDQIAAFRAGRDPGFVLNRDLLKLWIVTYGRDFGTAKVAEIQHREIRVAGGQRPVKRPVEIDRSRACATRHRNHVLDSDGGICSVEARDSRSEVQFDGIQVGLGAHDRRTQSVRAGKGRRGASGCGTCTT